VPLALDASKLSAYVLAVVRVPQGKSSPESEPSDNPFVPLIIESLRARGHLPRQNLTRVKAWDRARSLFEVVTADDVYAAWQLVRQAHSGVKLGADPELLDMRTVDFSRKLERWLNS